MLCASNSSSQMGTNIWIRLQLEDSRVNVVVLLTRRVAGDVVVTARFSQFVNGKSTKKMSLCERNSHSAPGTPEYTKPNKRERHTNHQELIRCGWWQGAVSANTRRFQSKQTGKETAKIYKHKDIQPLTGVPEKFFFFCTPRAY
jgi:hypothetical protein